MTLCGFCLLPGHILPVHHWPRCCQGNVLELLLAKTHRQCSLSPVHLTCAEHAAMATGAVLGQCAGGKHFWSNSGCSQSMWGKHNLANFCHVRTAPGCLSCHAACCLLQLCGLFPLVRCVGYVVPMCWVCSANVLGM